MHTLIYFIIIGLGCFIVGYFLGVIKGKNAAVKNSETNIQKDKHTKSSENTDTTPIRAIQTRGRRGTSVEEKVSEGIYKGVKSRKKEDMPVLNFSGIGMSSESEKDDLKRINGIGPFIEKKLNHIGIYTYLQISRFTEYEIDTVTRLIEFFPGRIKRDRWKQQATNLLNKPKGR